MKYVKTLGLGAIAAAALMAFLGAGSASAATTTTCGSGTLCPAETLVHAVSEGKVVLNAPYGNVECESTVNGHTTNVAGSPNGPITALIWTNCGNDTVHTLENGSLSVETEGTTSNNNGTLKSTGAKVTVVHLGIHCIYETNGTTIGKLTGSANTTNGAATLDISATIPRVGGISGAFCGTSGLLTGSYEVTTPSTLNID
ncbi:MAG: hypothetical protein ACTHK6_02935 [Solirubrobacterales bacterium]